MPEKELTLDIINNVVIIDTSCLIALSNLKLINLLEKTYTNIHITKEIADEFGEQIPDWINIDHIKDKNYQKILETFLDKGESSALALALEFDDVLLVFDDLKGRKEAQRLGFKITGTLGILHKAKEKGLIKRIKPVIEELKKYGFRISSKVENELLKQNNE